MASVIRNFTVDLGNTYPANTHQQSLDLITRLEGLGFTIVGGNRGDIRHGEVVINYNPGAKARPFEAVIQLTFYNDTLEPDPLIPSDHPSGFSDPPQNFRIRPLAVYPTEGDLKTEAER